MPASGKLLGRRHCHILEAGRVHLTEVDKSKHRGASAKSKIGLLLYCAHQYIASFDNLYELECQT
jgi:hypothetical protein